MKKIALALGAMFMLCGTNLYALDKSTMLQPGAEDHQEDTTTNPDKYYLKASELADSNEFLPPEPQLGSIKFQNDEIEYKKGVLLRDTPKGKFAYEVALMNGEGLIQVFSEPFGIEISKTNTPELYKLLKNLAEDAGTLGTKKAKIARHRIRPFKFYGVDTCNTVAQQTLNPYKSYPSGHTAVASAFALVLSEIDPTNQTKLIQRAYDVADARVNCGYHWRSDVEAGFVIGATTVATLHSNERFLEQVKKAKAEIKAIKEAQK